MTEPGRQPLERCGDAYPGLAGSAMGTVVTSGDVSVVAIVAAVAVAVMVVIIAVVAEQVVAFVVVEHVAEDRHRVGQITRRPFSQCVVDRVQIKGSSQSVASDPPISRSLPRPPFT